MLISALAEVKRRGGDTRTLGLYGQELIHMTCGHCPDEPRPARGRGLPDRPRRHARRARPSSRATVCKTFDVVLANPPYSIKKWNREAWQSDPWGRNFLGTPPQGRADYAFFQHILKSLDPSDRPLRDPLPARRPVPQRGSGDAAEARRERTCSSACSASGRTSSTTRRWRPASSSAAPGSRPQAPGEDPVYRCGA